MELRAFADGAVDLVRQLRRLQRIDVRLHRHREFRLRPRHGTEHRLAADDHELILVGHVRAGADDVLELLARHRARRVAGDGGGAASVASSVTPAFSS